MKVSFSRMFALLVAVVICSTAVIPVFAQDAPEEVTVTSLAVREDEDRTELILATTAQVEWSARSGGQDGVLLTLTGASLDSAVSDLTFPDGLVAAVEAGQTDIGGVPYTNILVRLREVRGYSVEATASELRLTLRPSSGEPANVEEVWEQAEAESADAGSPGAGSTAAADVETAGQEAIDAGAEAIEGVPAGGAGAAAAMANAGASRTGAPDSGAAETETPEARAYEGATPAGSPQAVADADLVASLEDAGTSIDPTFAEAGAEAGEYKIGPGDVLEVSVFGLEDFNRTVRVLRDGSISLPLLGGLRVAGMSLQQAEETVASMLTGRQLVKDPQVSFFVKEYVSRGVSIQGAVVKPGVYQMIQQRSLLEMLGEAGGLSGRENDRAGQQIFIIRKSEGGEQRRIEINVEELINQGRADLNIQLRPADVVLVPFAQKNRVYVSGAVEHPGPVEYLSSEGITVLQAITAAGGPSERGNLGNVKIVRKASDGSEARIEVNAKKIQKGKAEDVALSRNDTVIVGEWFF